MKFSSLALYLGISALLVINAFIWHAALAKRPNVLRVSFLDIGQGDSILIQGPTGIQMLVDGGPDHSVLRQLPREMGFFDRSIDMIVETHPDKDHIFGLTDVLDRYQVSYFMSPGIPDTTQTSIALNAAVAAESDVRTFTARRGMRIHLGGDAYADVLFPDRDVSTGPTNDGSVSMHIVYGTTSFMLTGDLPSSPGEDHLVALDGSKLESTVLKAGHHGSKFSTDDLWLATVHPSIVVISAGKDNKYGHPNPETIARIKNEGAEIVSTIDHGTIDFTSDGMTLTRRYEK